MKANATLAARPNEVSPKAYVDEGQKSSWSTNRRLPKAQQRPFVSIRSICKLAAGLSLLPGAASTSGPGAGGIGIGLAPPKDNLNCRRIQTIIQTSGSSYRCRFQTQEASTLCAIEALSRCGTMVGLTLTGNAEDMLGMHMNCMWLCEIMVCPPGVGPQSCL